VSNTGPTTYSGNVTKFDDPNAAETLALKEPARHGTVQLNPTGGAFTYTPKRPDPDTGEDLYFGWDFFSFEVTEPDGAVQEQWIQLYVGDYSVPTIVTLPPEEWFADVPGSPLYTGQPLGQGQPVNPQIFSNSQKGVRQAYDAATERLRLVMVALANFGQNAAQTAELSAISDEDLYPTFLKLDAVYQAYAEYTAYATSAFKQAGAYLKGWRPTSQADFNLTQQIQSLPIDIAGLRPSRAQVLQWSEALARYDEGAGFAVNLNKFVANLAKDTHDALQIALVAGGFASVATTGVELLMTQGCPAAIKYALQQAIAVSGSIVMSPAAAQGVALVSKFTGIDEQYVRIGADAIQCLLLLKAAKAERAKLNDCFAAGTEVMTQYGPLAIESLRLGQRVLTEVSATGPGAPPAVGGEADLTQVDPLTWRMVSLRMPDHSHPGSYLEVELLRPLGWINERKAAVGRWINFSVPELRISGMAEVTGIDACPAIESGYGRVVLGTFASVSTDVYELKLAGDAGPIGLTGGHPIWSLDRGGWISARALAAGERLATAAGEARVESVLPMAGRQAVYSLYVEADHRYLVGDLGVLVHNAAPSCPNSAWEWTIKATGRKINLRGIEIRRITYTKRDRAAYEQLREDFDNGIRRDFLQSLANDPSKAAALRGAGLTPTDIIELKAGRVPTDFRVHHKLPLDDGGTNDFDNLILVRHDPLHKAFSSYQTIMTGHLEVGQSMELDWPIPNGFVLGL